MSRAAICERVKPQLVVAKSHAAHIKSHGSIQTPAENEKDWELLFESHYLDRCYAGFALFDKKFSLRGGNRIYDSILRKHASYSLDELIGKSYFKIAPGSAEIAGPWFRRVMSQAKGEVVYNFEQKILQQHNYALSYFDAYLFPLTDDLGESSGCVMCCIDVTEDMIRRMHIIEKKQALMSEGQFSDNVTSEIMKSSSVGYLNYNLNIELDRSDHHDKNNEIRNENYKYADNVVNIKENLSFKNIFSRQNNIQRGYFSLTRDVFDLTPTEIQVAEWVKLGKSSKEIAYILCVSKDCIDFHRNNIRKKLGLTKSKINLNRFLNSTLGEE